jgi:transcriptional regulator with XRE-family HTH domain
MMPQPAAEKLIAYYAERAGNRIGGGPDAETLVKFRELLGLNQQAMAKVLKLSPSLVRGIESGNRPASIQAIKAYRQYAKAKGYDLDKLAA